MWYNTTIYDTKGNDTTMAYYIKQIRASNGTKRDMFYSTDRRLNPVFDNRTATYNTMGEVYIGLTFAKRKFGGMWEIRKKDGTKDNSIVRQETEPTLHEIERDVMRGKHVSLHNLNRLMRSPRGLMMMASLHR